MNKCSFNCDVHVVEQRISLTDILSSRDAESEQESESELPGVVATSQELESESKPIKLPQLRLQNVVFESEI